MQQFAIRRFVALGFWILGALYSGARLMLDVIGYTTAPDDFARLLEKLPDWLKWLFSTPWWVPGGLMLVLTLFVIWVSWPRRTVRAVSIEQATKEGLIDARQLPAKSGYVDTRLRLRLDRSGTNIYIVESLANIYTWQQVFTNFSYEREGKEKIIAHNDTIIIAFDTEIEYERPILESFGHKLGNYNFFPIGTKGAIFQFLETVQAPIVEFFFPPIGYYAQRVLKEGEESQPPDRL